MRSLLDKPWVLFFASWVLLLVVEEAGVRAARMSRLTDDEYRREQVEQLRDWMLVFLSLLLAFTLALAAPHFDYRYQLVLSEASAIRTTYLRAKGLPEPYQSNIAAALKHYVDARVEFLSAGLDQSRINAATASARKIQNRIWSEASQLTHTNPTVITEGFIDSLSQMTDFEKKKAASLDYRVPMVVWALVFFVGLLATLVSGLAMHKRLWLTTFIMPLTVAIVVALIVEFDSPRGGFVLVDHKEMNQLQADIESAERVPR